MEKSINAPYIKNLDENGNCTNPITKGGYFSKGKNRKERRSENQKDRFVGNGKNYHITVIGRYKFVRILQVIRDKAGKFKSIFHYIPS